jgi:hypothetical protein
MNSPLVKKFIIVFSIVITVVIAAVVIAFATGNTKYPLLSDPDGIFYERLDDSDKVLYSITNQELYDTIKTKDGLQQLLLLVDLTLLEDTFDSITEEAILERLQIMTYGTADPDELAELTDEKKAELEKDYETNMILSGYQDKEREYALLALAREEAARQMILESGDITDLKTATEFFSNSWDDIRAVRIRFMSSSDAASALRDRNLLTYGVSSLRRFNGYNFKMESLLDPDDELVEAYQTVTTYYFDTDENIRNLKEEILYTKGTGNVYTDEDDEEYTLDATTGNLLDEDLETVIESDKIFDSLELAESYKEAHTTYYTVTKTDPFDEDERARVINAADQVKFTIDKNGKIYDDHDTDVTATTDLYVNKVYTPIDKISRVSLFNSSELTDQELLAEFIDMYNEVYGLYRPLLPTDATIAELSASDDEYLLFNYSDVKDISSGLATYMFKTLDITDDSVERYSPTPKSYPGTNNTANYLVFKLTQPEKVAAHQIMLDHIESHILIPLTVGGNITLPTKGWYSSSIAWTSSNTTVLTSAGIFTAPETDTTVDMTYRINFSGYYRSGKITVNCLADGDTVLVDASTDEEITFKTVLNDDTLYASLQETLVDSMLTGSTANTNLSKYLFEFREKYGFKISDFWLGLTYNRSFSDYDYETKGDKEVVATLSGKPSAETTPIEITADDLFNYAVSKNTALYLLFASLHQEILFATPYYTDTFGTQLDFYKNKSDRMQDLLAYVESIKDSYAYYQNFYQQNPLYGDFPYDSFLEFIYIEHNGAKSERDLLRDSITATLQTFMIDESLDEYDLFELIYPTVEENFTNYFSLNVTHLLILYDFDEDGTPDDYYDYLDELDAADKLDAYDALKAGLYTEISDYLADEDNDFTSLVSAYRAATYDDDTWGIYKKNGFQLLTQDLNIEDSEDSEVTHALHFSGEYGVKDSYDPEFVEALIDLYTEYNLPQNLEKTELVSGLVDTVNGNHIIEVTKPSDFARPSAMFAETDPLNPEYSEGVENTSDLPTIEQVRLYAKYYFLEQLYDLTQEGVEEKYNITIPDIPATLRRKIATFSEDIISELYTLGTLNIYHADQLLDGSFPDNDYSLRSEAQLLQLLIDTKNAYYQTMFAKYESDSE